MLLSRASSFFEIGIHRKIFFDNLLIFFSFYQGFIYYYKQPKILYQIWSNNPYYFFQEYCGHSPNKINSMENQLHLIGLVLFVDVFI